MHVTLEARLHILKLLAGAALYMSIHLIEHLGPLYAQPDDIPSLTSLIKDDTIKHSLDSKTVRQLRSPVSEKCLVPKVSPL